MEASLKLDFLEIYNLYIMYKELFALCLEKNEFENAKTYFYKILKYYNGIMQNIDSFYSERPQNEKDNVLKEIKIGIENTKKVAVESLGKVDFDFQDSELDSFEETFLLYDTEIACIKLSILLYPLETWYSIINFLKRAVSLNSQNYEIYLTIANCYDKLEMPRSAIAYFEEYDKHCPNNPVVYCALGGLYSSFGSLNNLEIARKYLEKAYALKPDSIAVVRCLAILYLNIGEDEKSLEFYEKLIKMAPKNDDYFDYACAKIKLGYFKDGWKLYEYRFTKETGATKYPEFDKPRWEGQKLSDGETLLVYFEQGFGDSICFARYLKQVKALAKNVIFVVQDELLDLFKLNFSDIEIVGKSEPLSNLKFDYHVPLMSLMNVLRARIDNIPFQGGYISADLAKIQQYKEKYFDNDCFKIGISWSGNRYGNIRRNVPVEAFYPLTKLKNVKVYAFQKGYEALNSNDKSEIINLGGTFNDFSDTAAAMANLDLFITSDNVNLNLAGAMGVKTFLLLNNIHEWRWFAGKPETPWYSSVEIFKKLSDCENWDTLMQKIIERLQ